MIRLLPWARRRSSSSFRVEVPFVTGARIIRPGLFDLSGRQFLLRVEEVALEFLVQLGPVLGFALTVFDAGKTSGLGGGRRGFSRHGAGEIAVAIVRRQEHVPNPPLPT